MYIPKKYGMSKTEECPFCGKLAISQNEQGIAVCIDHKNAIVNDLKCFCGDYLLFQKGKFGVFCSCIKCGNISLKKALEINNVNGSARIENNYKIANNIKTDVKTTSAGFNNSIGDAKNGSVKKSPVKKDLVIRSDDPDYF